MAEPIRYSCLRSSLVKLKGWNHNSYTCKVEKILLQWYWSVKKKGKRSSAKHSLFAFVRNCLVAGDFLVQLTGTVKIKGKKDIRSIKIVTRESHNTNLYGPILECIIAWFYCSSSTEAIMPGCRVPLKCVSNSFGVNSYALELIWRSFRQVCFFSVF